MYHDTGIPCMDKWTQSVDEGSTIDCIFYMDFSMFRTGLMYMYSYWCIHRVAIAEWLARRTPNHKILLGSSPAMLQSNKHYYSIYILLLLNMLKMKADWISPEIKIWTKHFLEGRTLVFCTVSQEYPNPGISSWTAALCHIYKWPAWNNPVKH